MAKRRKKRATAAQLKALAKARAARKRKAPKKAKRRTTRKRKATAAQLRALAKGRRALKRKRSRKRKSPLTQLKQRVKRIRSKSKRAHRKHRYSEPVLRAKHGEHQRTALQRPYHGARFPIRGNPGIGNYWKLVIHAGRQLEEIIGRGPRAKAEREAQAIMRNRRARKVELLGPYRTEAAALAA